MFVVLFDRAVRWTYLYNVTDTICTCISYATRRIVSPHDKRIHTSPVLPRTRLLTIVSDNRRVGHRNSASSNLRSSASLYSLTLSLSLSLSLSLCFAQHIDTVKLLALNNTHALATHEETHERSASAGERALIEKRRREEKRGML